MSASSLDKIKLGFSPLSGECYLYRHGSDPATALDKRKATPEVQMVLVEYMMHEAPKGASQRVTFGDGWYEITVRPCQDKKQGAISPNEITPQIY